MMQLVSLVGVPGDVTLRLWPILLLAVVLVICLPLAAVLGRNRSRPG
jgi:hypothetical protein